MSIQQFLRAPRPSLQTEVWCIHFASKILFKQGQNVKIVPTCTHTKDKLDNRFTRQTTVINGVCIKMLKKYH